MQAEIGAWHVAEFGEFGDEKALVRKLAEEVGEFVESPSAEEAADICIVLYAWAHRAGVDLNQAVAEKFAVVRSRGQFQRDQQRGFFDAAPAVPTGARDE